MPSDTLSGNLEQTLSLIKQELGESDDLIYRRIQVFGRYPAAVVYYYSMVDQALLNLSILKPLMQVPVHLEDVEWLPPESLKQVLVEEALYYGGIKLEKTASGMIRGILRGDTLVVVDGVDEIFLVGCRKIDKRSIEQPETEVIIRGPRDGFIEMLETNLALLRYRLQSKTFRIQIMELGVRTTTKVAICYLEDVADPALVDEVKKRLSAIKIDAILDSGYLEQFIEDNHYSPFPQVQNTERPDKAVSNLLEGRVVLFADGSPIALMVPAVFNQFYQTVEDYSERFLLVSAIRLIRVVALVFSLFFSSIYVAIIAYNPELIPTEFAVAVAGGRAGVPFPALVEVLIMEIAMEVLREATIRLPQQIGGALSIVGVLIVGQAAVSAGFASPITVVIIALTTIGSFATPAYNAALALRLLRFPMIILAGIFGLFGIMTGLILVANHLLTLRSFGVPYLSPYVPGGWSGLKDWTIRAPLWTMRKRPGFLHPRDRTRLDSRPRDPEQVLDPGQNSEDRERKP